MGRLSVCPSTSTSKSGIARASVPMRCKMGAAAGNGSALREEKLMVRLSVTIRSEPRTATWTASARPSAATNSSRLRPAAASRSAAASRGRSPSDGGSAAAGEGSGRSSATFSAATSGVCGSARAQPGASTANRAGAGGGDAGGTAAEGRPPPESTTETSTKAKSWSTRSLNVTSHPVWSSSSGAGSSPSARRRSGRALRKLCDTAWSFGGRPHVRAQQALDSRGVLPLVHEQDAVDDHLATEALAPEVGVELGGEREDHDVGEHGAVERREHGDAEPGTNRREARLDQMPEQEHETDQGAGQPEGRKKLPEGDEHLTRGLAFGRGPSGLGEENVGQLFLVLTLERQPDAAAHERIGFGRRRAVQRGHTPGAVEAGQALEGGDDVLRAGLVLEGRRDVAPRADQPGTGGGRARHPESAPDGDEEGERVHEARGEREHCHRRGQPQADPEVSRTAHRFQRRTHAHGPESSSGARGGAAAFQGRRVTRARQNRPQGSFPAGGSDAVRRRSRVRDNRPGA